MKTIQCVMATLACVISLASFASETVYKWTDESGRVHFSDRPLRDADSEEVRVMSSQPATDDESSESEESAESEDEAAAPKASDKGAKQAEQEKQRKQLQEQNCKIARQTLEHNESIERMYRVDANGERVFLADEEREMVLNRSREDVEKWCD